MRRRKKTLKQKRMGCRSLISLNTKRELRLNGVPSCLKLKIKPHRSQRKPMRSWLQPAPHYFPLCLSVYQNGSRGFSLPAPKTRSPNSIENG